MAVKGRAFIDEGCKKALTTAMSVVFRCRDGLARGARTTCCYVVFDKYLPAYSRMRRKKAGKKVVP